MSTSIDAWRQADEERKAHYRELAEQAQGGPLPGFVWKDIHSEALAVHPAQREEAVEDAISKGVPTEFDPEGRPVFTSSRHFRAYCRAYKFRHRGY